MSIEAITLISVRILGLFLLGQGILALGNLYYLIEMPDKYEIPATIYTMHTIAIIAPLILGLAVIIFSKSLSQWVCPKHAESSDDSTPQLPEIQSMAFSVLGLLIVFLSLPSLVSSFVAIYQSNAVNERQADYISNPAFLSSLLSVVFGCFLFIGATFWVRVYRKFREFGLNEK